MAETLAEAVLDQVGMVVANASARSSFSVVSGLICRRWTQTQSAAPVAARTGMRWLD
jgi:hypothetical protein